MLLFIRTLVGNSVTNCQGLYLFCSYKRLMKTFFSMKGAIVYRARYVSFPSLHFRGKLNKYIRTSFCRVCWLCVPNVMNSKPCLTKVQHPKFGAFFLRYTVYIALTRLEWGCVWSSWYTVYSRWVTTVRDILLYHAALACNASCGKKQT